MRHTKRRTDVVAIFPNEAAIVRLVGAMLPVDPLGVLWVRFPSAYLAHSYNDMHPGVQLVFSPDGSKLFVKRGTAMDKRGMAPLLGKPIWSDCIVVATRESCGGVRTCCMEERPGDGHTDHEGVMRDSKKVEAIARAAGIVN